MGDLAHFFVIIGRFVIMLDCNMDFRNFITHAAERRRAGAILARRRRLTENGPAFITDINLMRVGFLLLRENPLNEFFLE